MPGRRKNFPLAAGLGAHTRQLSPPPPEEDEITKIPDICTDGREYSILGKIIFY